MLNRTHNSVLFSEEKEEGSSSDLSSSDEDDDSAIKTLCISQLTLHCRLSGSGEPWESPSVTSGLN